MSTNRWLATGNFFTSYKEEQRIYRTHLDRSIFIVFLAVLFIWPLFFPVKNSTMLVIDNVMIAMIAVLGLNIVTGFAGLISIGHAAFVGIGAYAVGTAVTLLGKNHELIVYGWPVMILLGGMAGAAFGALVGLPALRLKHLYLAIATLSFQIIFEWVIMLMSFFDQGQTIAVGRVYWFGGKVLRQQHYTFWYYAILVFLILCGFMVRNLLRTRHGRCLIAVRDNDRAADAMGMHPGFTKVYAFIVAGLLAGIAGALKAYLDRGVGIESYTLHTSIEYLAMAIVGGLGTLNGSLWGPAAIQMLDLRVEELAELSGHYLPAELNLATALRPLTFGLVIVLFLMFEPRGIANWWRMFRSYTKLWPFRY
ncbi:MAG: branched-chain amino acid ABC transporter permease [SAR324 cluster bacterium]|uniref:Branched-chain amino acid ABC transporter permease n=1 Tax=SAR324 cluster bacterium TaxID=2024889 RepID=A0A2A4T6F6_9DELT|nr:MAG: branched-chain amino acid ABC transporter permease [SAR324 cluster bacterium]